MLDKMVTDEFKEQKWWEDMTFVLAFYSNTSLQSIISIYHEPISDWVTSGTVTADLYSISSSVSQTKDYKNSFLLYVQQQKRTVWSLYRGRLTRKPKGPCVVY